MSAADDRTAAMRRPPAPDAPPEILIQAATLSDRGLVRRNNEDACVVADLGPGPVDVTVTTGSMGRVGRKGVLLAVSDGMGGQLAGEVASRLAVETLHRSLRRDWSERPQRDAEAELRNDLRIAVDLANQAVLKEASENPAQQGMGATLTAAVVFGRSLVVAHVGDSRCYLCRGGFLKPLTSDQSLAEELARQGVVERDSEAYAQRKSMLTRAVGARQGRLVPDAERADLARGDRILLCSDGLTGPVSEEEIRGALAAADGPESAARALVEAANRHGAPDNVTCVVAFVHGEGLPDPAELDSADSTMTARVDAKMLLAAADSTQSLAAARRDSTAEFGSSLPAPSEAAPPAPGPAAAAAPPPPASSTPSASPAPLPTPIAPLAAPPAPAPGAVRSPAPSSDRASRLTLLVVALLAGAALLAAYLLSR